MGCVEKKKDGQQSGREKHGRTRHRTLNKIDTRKNLLKNIEERGGTFRGHRSRSRPPPEKDQNHHTSIKGDVKTLPVWTCEVKTNKRDNRVRADTEKAEKFHFRTQKNGNFYNSFDELNVGSGFRGMLMWRDAHALMTNSQIVRSYYHVIKRTDESSPRTHIPACFYRRGNTNTFQRNVYVVARVTRNKEGKFWKMENEFLFRLISLCVWARKKRKKKEKRNKFKGWFSGEG